MLKFLATTLGRKPPPPLTDLHSISRWMDALPMGDSVEAIDEIDRESHDDGSRKIFVVHGHDHPEKDRVTQYLKSLNLIPIILDEFIFNK